MPAPVRTLAPPRRPRLPAARPSIALALGGGGARGLAHIVILEAFDELGIRPNVIAGTSIGAIYGAAYASGMSAAAIRAHTEETLGQRLDLFRQLFAARAEPLSKLLSLVPFRASLLNPETLLAALLPAPLASTFGELAIPLLTVATDYHTHEQVVFEAGPLLPAVAASIALPALFLPPRIDGRVLMDGGLVNPLPFDVLAGRADVTIAIDVSGAGVEVAAGDRAMPTAFEALIASSQILQGSIVREKLRWQQPDIIIRMPVNAFHVLDFLKFRDILAAAAPAKAELKSKLARLFGAETVPALPAPAAAPAIPAAPSGPKRLPRPRKPKSR